MNISRAVSLAVVFMKYGSKWSPKKKILAYLCGLTLAATLSISRATGQDAILFPTASGMFLGLYMIYDELEDRDSGILKRLVDKLKAFGLDVVRGLINNIIEPKSIRKFEKAVIPNVKIGKKYALIPVYVVLGIITGMVLYLTTYAKLKKKPFKEVLKQVRTVFYVKVITIMLLSKFTNYSARQEYINKDVYSFKEIDKIEHPRIKDLMAAMKEKIDDLPDKIAIIDPDDLVNSRYEVPFIPKKLLKIKVEYAVPLAYFFLRMSSRNMIMYAVSAASCLFNIYHIFLGKSSSTEILFMITQFFWSLMYGYSSRLQKDVDYVAKKLNFDKELLEGILKDVFRVRIKSNFLIDIINEFKEKKR